MDVINQNVHIVDRTDQVKWYLDPVFSTNFCVQLKDNHRYLRNWLRSMTQGTVVISCQGVMPRIGTNDHAYHTLLQSVQKDQYKVYFEDEQDAATFKLAWGGSL
jgi:hypothetical protein